VESEGAISVLDKLDVFMDSGRVDFLALATAHADTKAEAGSDQHRQSSSQFLKSNTGKMFERFVGLAMAHCLVLADADYCITSFIDQSLRLCHDLTPNDFAVDFKFGDGTLNTKIDADLLAFNPTAPHADIFMISVKST